MALLGSGFSGSDPTDSQDLSSIGSWLRDTKTRLKAFVSVMFNPDTGYLNNDTVTSAMLSKVLSTPGTFAGLTIGTDGRVTTAAAVTTLAGYGITDGLSNAQGTFYQATVTLPAASAATPVTLLADASVPAGKKAYLINIMGKVNGGVAWSVATSVKVRDSNGSPVTFLTIPQANLTGNARLLMATSGVVVEDATIMGTGGTTAKGLQVVADANDAGSDLVLTAFILVK